MKVFVTGGAGFIGSHLVKKLLQRGDFVTVYDNFSTGKRTFLEDCPGKQLTIIAADLLDEVKLKASMKGHDFVFHMAANPDVRIGEKDPSKELNNGIIATYNVLEAMRANGITKIAFSSSSVVYGEPTQFPTPETYGPLLPISLYGASKLSSEALISAYCGTFSYTCWLFRFANIVGPQATHGLIYDLMQKLQKNKNILEVLGDGKQRKAYVHVTDCVDAILSTIDKDASPATLKLYNISNADQISVANIAQLLLKELAIPAAIKFTGTKRGWAGDVTVMHLDPKKINRLGWKPKMNSKETVIRAITELRTACNL